MDKIEPVVTQADRDGAAEYWKGLVNLPELELMRAGKRDDHWKIQELAKKRTQSTATLQARLDAMVEALREIVKDREAVIRECAAAAIKWKNYCEYNLVNGGGQYEGEHRSGKAIAHLIESDIIALIDKE